MIELRALTPDDWPIWRELRIAALTDAPHAFTTRLADVQGDREKRWRSRLELPGSHNLIALLDARPSGMASGVPADDGAAELISMWVSPPARGHGVGDELITEIERWARQSNAQLLRLCVMRDNNPAIALYHRHGFTSDQSPSTGTPGQLTLAKKLS